MFILREQYIQQGTQRICGCMRLLDQEKTAIAAKAADAKIFIQKINALENDSEGFFKLGGFMADSSSSADELLEEALTDKYGI